MDGMAVRSVSSMRDRGRVGTSAARWPNNVDRQSSNQAASDPLAGAASVEKPLSVSATKTRQHSKSLLRCRMILQPSRQLRPIAARRAPTPTLLRRHAPSTSSKAHTETARCADPAVRSRKHASNRREFRFNPVRSPRFPGVQPCAPDVDYFGMPPASVG